MFLIGLLACGPAVQAQTAPPSVTQTVEPTSGCPGDPIHISGTGAPPNAPISVFWSSRAYGIPVIADITSDADGTYSIDSVVPDTAGGTLLHGTNNPIRAIENKPGGRDLASTDFLIPASCSQRAVDRNQLANTGDTFAPLALIAVATIVIGCGLTMVRRRL
ncbi:MAG: hypothetical protein JO291_12085 [Acidimicrobiia bacterium]|nr:hypothetical protein [Acidimicrobiia bacterium]